MTDRDGLSAAVGHADNEDKNKTEEEQKKDWHDSRQNDDPNSDWQGKRHCTTMKKVKRRFLQRVEPGYLS
jgi:hypothetical protein